jgi:hypothetical protein
MQRLAAVRAPEPLLKALQRPALMAGIGAGAAALVALRPLASGFWAHDVRWHLVRIAQWHRGVLDGVLYPRFFHDVFWGHGGPVMLFYPPAPYVVTEIFCLLGAGPVAALSLGIAVAFTAAAAGVFLLARETAGRAGAWVAAAAYTLAPYHLLNAWVRAAYAELLAMAVLPFLLLAARAAARSRSARAASGLAAAAGLLVLTHLVTAVFALPLAAAYGLLHAAEGPRGGRFRAAARVAAGLAAGVGIATFYWAPAVLERGLTRIEESYERGSRPDRHFLEPGQLLETWWGFGWSGPGRDTMSFQIGWVHLAALSGGIVLAARGPAPARREARFWVAASAAGAYLTLGASAWIWERAPALPSIQFPWRLLVIPALGASLCAGALARPAGEPAPAWRTAIPPAAVALLILAYLPFTASRPPRYTDDQVSPAALASEAGAEWMWMPTGAQEGIPPGPRALIAAGDGEVEVIDDRTHVLAARVRARSAAAVKARIYAFPGWRAEVDGRAAGTRADASGAIVVDVPPGDHALRLTFGSTPPRRRAAWISAVCLALAAAGLMARSR